MTLQEDFIIETNRLYLREMNTRDAEFLFTLNADAEVMQYTGNTAFNCIEEASAFLASYDHYTKYGFGRWAVILKSDGSFLGWCGIKYDAELKEHDLGYRFFKKYWNNGYATEAAGACLKHGFQKLGLTEITGRAMVKNAASVAVLKKLGFTFKNFFLFSGEQAADHRITAGQYRALNLQ